MKSVFRFLFAFLLAFVFCAPAKAEVLTFYGDDQGAVMTPAEAESQFQSNLLGVAVEDFSFGSGIDFGNGITATASTGSISSDLWLVSRNTFTLTFSQSINAFGTNIYDVDQNADLVASYNSNIIDIPHPVVGSLTNEEHFWGIIDTESSFSQITFTGIAMNILWDNMQVGVPNVQIVPVTTPEPSTFLLLGAGMLGLFFIRRKRA